MAGMFVGICPQNRNGSLCTKAGGPLPEQWTCTGSLEKVRGGEGLRAGVSERTQDEWLVSQWCTRLAQTHHDFSHSRSQVHSWTLYTTLRVPRTSRTLKHLKARPLLPSSSNSKFCSYILSTFLANLGKYRSPFLKHREPGTWPFIQLFLWQRSS